MFTNRIDWLIYERKKKKKKIVLFDDANMESLDKNGRFSFCALKKKKILFVCYYLSDGFLIDKSNASTISLVLLFLLLLLSLWSRLKL